MFLLLYCPFFPCVAYCGGNNDGWLLRASQLVPCRACRVASHFIEQLTPVHIALIYLQRFQKFVGEYIVML